jgi:hypothetical protein
VRAPVAGRALVKVVPAAISGWKGALAGLGFFGRFVLIQSN